MQDASLGLGLAILGVLLLALPPLYGYPAEWSLVIGASSLALGSVSLLVYVRRLLFAAAGAPHAAFFAASLAIILSVEVGGPRLVWTVLVGLLIIYALGYATYRGMDPDDATALVVSTSSSLGVLTAIYVLSRYSYGSSVLGVVMGDPLLARGPEVVACVAIAVVSLILTLATAREVAYIGLDRDDAMLSGIRVWLYDLALYTLLGVTVMGLVRIVGFVIEHVLLLLPGAIAVSTGRSGYGSLAVSTGTTLAAGGLGLSASILFNLSPSGVIGLAVAAGYLLSAVLRR